MKKQPQQPNMDEWLLDPMHGLEEGDEQNIHHHFKRSDFLNSLTYQYVCTIHSTRTPYWLEKQTKRLISRSIWPRILLMRCRSLIHTALQLSENGHWKFMDVTLQYIRIILHYAGFIMHGLRLLINIVTLLESLTSEESAFEGFKQQFTRTGFELFNDALWIISAGAPSGYLALSGSLMGLELGLVALRAVIEIKPLYCIVEAFNNALGDSELDVDSINELTLSAAHASAKYNHTVHKFILNLSVTVTTTMVFIVRYVVIPSFSTTFAANPFVSFIFAALALAISLANHYMSKSIDNDKPKIKIEALAGIHSSGIARNTFFTARAPELVLAETEPVLAPSG